MAIMKRVENEDREPGAVENEDREPSAVENEDHEPNTVENGREKQEEEKQIKDETLLQFLDSTDGYLTLIDSLSSTLRQVTTIILREKKKLFLTELILQN